MNAIINLLHNLVINGLCCWIFITFKHALHMCLGIYLFCIQLI